jgi:hypothetical protein
VALRGKTGKKKKKLYKDNVLLTACYVDDQVQEN